MGNVFLDKASQGLNAERETRSNVALCFYRNLAFFIQILKEVQTLKRLKLKCR